MSFVRIRLLRTEGFRLSAIYAGAFALSVLAMGAVMLVITDQAFRDQVVQYSRTDLAAIQDGYRSEGMAEAARGHKPADGGAGRIGFLRASEKRRGSGGQSLRPAAQDGRGDVARGRPLPRHPRRRHDAGAWHLCFFRQRSLPRAACPARQPAFWCRRCFRLFSAGTCCSPCWVGLSSAAASTCLAVPETPWPGPAAPSWMAT